MVKIIDNNYAKADLKQVVHNASQLNAQERTMLLNLLKYFKDLFDGTLGNQATDPVDLELNPDSKLLNSKYYPVPRINKGNF